MINLNSALPFRWTAQSGMPSYGHDSHPPLEYRDVPGVCQSRQRIRRRVYSRGEDHGNFLPPDLPCKETSPGKRRVLSQCAGSSGGGISALQAMSSAGTARSGSRMVAPPADSRREQSHPALARSGFEKPVHGSDPCPSLVSGPSRHDISRLRADSATWQGSGKTLARR